MVSHRYVTIPDPRDEGFCSVNVVKGIFVIFNTFYLISGLLVGGVGVWNYYTQHSYLLLLTTVAFPLITWLLVVTGLVVVVGSLLGCCAVRSESRGCMAVYTLVIVAVFMSELVVGMLAYVYHDQIEQDLQRNLREVFLQTYGVEAQQTRAIDGMQQELSCCGALSFEDWQDSVWFKTASKRNRVPDSCCKSVSEGCGVRDHPSNIPYTGCAHPMSSEIKSQLVILGAVGLSCSVLQIVGFLYSTMLLSKFFSLNRKLKGKRRTNDKSKSGCQRSTSSPSSTNGKGYHPVYSNGEKMQRTN